MNLSLILHPLDYSAGAKPALARALALAKWHDADLHAPCGRAGVALTVRRLPTRACGSSWRRATGAAKFETVILAGDPGNGSRGLRSPQIAGPLVVDKHGRRASKLWRAGVSPRSWRVS